MELPKNKTALCKCSFLVQLLGLIFAVFLIPIFVTLFFDKRLIGSNWVTTENFLPKVSFFFQMRYIHIIWLLLLWLKEHCENFYRLVLIFLHHKISFLNMKNEKEGFFTDNLLLVTFGCNFLRLSTRFCELKSKSFQTINNMAFKVFTIV